MSALSRYKLNRRTVMSGFLAISGSAIGASLLGRQAFADVPVNQPLHGISAFGELKYAADFTHFDYASPDAPKGGNFTFNPPVWALNQNPQTFNTLNSFSAKGDAPPRMELTFDSLMVAALDEPDALYGLVAKTITLSEDRNACLYELRTEARFHDGSPLTAADVAFTYQTLKEKGHPELRLTLAEFISAEADGDHKVRLVFSGKQSPRAFLDAATMPILSAKWYENHSFERSALEAPLGSGAYRVGKLSAGQFIEYERVADYWAKDLAAQRGMNHFDLIRIEFFLDRQPEFEAFKKGILDWRSESVAKLWTTEYNFPAMQQKKIVKRTFPRERRPTMQAWAVNQRRERFRDPRVREAISLCFDFEWTNKNLFFGLYARAQSCFGNSDFEAVGLPTSDELDVLARYRDRVPEAIFEAPVSMAVSDGTGRDRAQFSRAIKLLQDAGFERQNGHFLDKDGQTFKLELLSNSQSLNRVYEPLVQRMRSIGIDASLRMVDAVQYQARVQNFDFDMMGMAMLSSPTPTRESLSSMFSSASADINGSRNYPGAKDALLDEMIDAIGAVQSRADLIAHMRVLDRYLRLRRDWIPNWTSANHLIAYWDRFGFKEPKPDYGFPVETLWWIDEEKAKAIGKL